MFSRRPTRAILVAAISGIVTLGVVSCSSTGSGNQPEVAETSSSASANQEIKVSSFEKEAQYGNGVTATVVKIDRVTLPANGPGEIAGPGIQTQIRITNGTGAEIDLTNSVVNVFYGANRTPAATANSSDTPFTGSLAPGQSATGVYNFLVPAKGAPVFLEVSYAPDQPVAVFTGKV